MTSDDIAVLGLREYAEGGREIWVPNNESGWFEWLKRLFGFGKQTVPKVEVPEPGTDPAPTIPHGRVQHSAGAAVSEFGESLIGVVEIGSQGSRVTAGTYAKNVNHLTLSKQNMGPLQTGQRRFGFRRDERSIIIGPSSTGMIPTIDEIPAIRTILEHQEYLTPGGLYLIVAEDGNGEQHLYNLLTGEAIQ